MKCPKCNYLGFDTGDRCKHCGYDFSLMPMDLDLKPAAGAAARVPDLPLFAPATDDDEPLVKLPAAPRPPLAVRRTPDAPRPRAMPKPVEKIAAAPAVVVSSVVSGFSRTEPVVSGSSRTAPAPVHASSSGARLTAAVIDVAILAAVDASILYLTLRMAALEMSDWRMLPPVPMLAFLLLLKLAYFAAFTAIGGQTIGKMAAGIRVVTDDNRTLEPVRAVQRTLAGIVSLVTLGAGFVLALFAADHRALHDRLAHTRVIALRS